ncbi:autoinducer binding domain-containing protein [Legionella pneumophila subsp. fraseri]|uniref:Transcription factor LuxR-like autoinducer-binding domain-containing protein n=1 Tax=Legionella pneumophila TaxID=446 RepID=A0AAN5KSZ1_LEGPN|nr:MULTISPECIES: autoinducer binding domain-containing protein [Legionella]MDW8879666.1 autoinducer binding domain-containing protein [Legionella pneumophila subsp. fraseri]MDW8962565.1 autoinducer binding domain-containing protein [Legionella pneumophila subsp. fraseri]NSL19030.1 autoinducer binding domain-containing protein [Legionella micdadei]CZG84787.1 Autoinducer binding domain [Legionella pneumophila]STY13121.1 Autoinducer binding domain [Legionella pneumophila]
MIHDVPKRIFLPFDEKQELLFNKQLRPLNALGCDYFYYLVSDQTSKSKSYRFCTHEDWMTFYYEEKLIENDPLKRIVEKSNISVLPWNQASFMNKHEKQTMSGRSAFGLYNGVSIVSKFNNKNYIFVLATEHRDHDLARYLLLEKNYELKKLMHGCITSLEGWCG